jgi:hypothetical protein
MKLWGGRFEQGPSEVFERFSNSLAFDRRLIDADILGSQAFARALERVGILTAAERGAIVKAFGEILEESRLPEFFDRATDEDVHTLVIRKLSEKAGVLAEKIHTGRSRNEQVSLDTRLWLRGAIDEVRSRLTALMESLLGLARRDPAAVLPGFTHMRRAQAVRARLGAVRSGPESGQFTAPGLRRAGRQRLPLRPGKDRPRPGLRRNHPQQHGRFRRPRLRSRLPARGGPDHAAPEPPVGGLDSLLQ